MSSTAITSYLCVLALFSSLAFKFCQSLSKEVSFGDEFYNYRIFNSFAKSTNTATHSDEYAYQTMVGNDSGNHLTILFGLYGEEYEIKLKVLNSSIFTANAFLTITESAKKTDTHLRDIKDLQVYEGYLENDNNSYVTGTVINNVFLGVVMFSNGSVVYMEQMKHVYGSNHSKYENVVVYKGADVKFTSCSRSGNHSNETCHDSGYSTSHFCKREGKKKIVCFQSKADPEASVFPRIYSGSTPSSKSKQRPRFNIRNSTCTIEVLADASYLVNDHKNDVKSALREMLIIILQANRILREVDFDSDGLPDNFSLRIGHAEVHKDSKTSLLTNDSLNEINASMDSFRKRPQDYCLSVMFYSEKIATNIISITLGGGICKSNENENEPSKNVVILNTFNFRSRRPLFATTWATTMALGQNMGSIERECEVPLSYPPEDDWTLFFSDCRRHNMANTLATQGYCLEMLEGNEVYSLQTENPVQEVTEPNLCGNGKVDLGEECDCGSVDACARRSSCCVAPGQPDECTYDRKQGYECDWSDSCCNHDCKLIPESWKTFCALGEPTCAPENAYCDGKSPKCPFPIGAASITDGQSCRPNLLKFNGAATCLKGFCNSSVCRDGGLQDCTCSQESAQECRVCCKNGSDETEELCVTAEYFGLKPKKGKYFYRYPGTPCQSVRFGHCSRSGTCVQYLTAGAELAALQEEKVLPLLYVVWIIVWRTLTFKIF